MEAASHRLDDPEGETRLTMDLTESLTRAAKLKGTLLAGHVIYCAPGVKGGFETYSHIVQANGGVCINFRSGKRGANTPEEVPKNGKLVLLSSDAQGDQKLWKPFVALAKQLGAEPLIYRTDWLLNAGMTQRLVYEDSYLVPQKK